jgi:flagellar hook protein FlgE
MQQFQDQMDVIGNNIANVNTTGFKSARVNFAESFSDTLRASLPGDGTTSGAPAMQIGSGVAIGSIRNQYLQGTLSQTSVPSDLAISGDGFFIVKDALANSEFATRAGNFHLDQNGYLVTEGGLRVQGFADAGLSQRGDIRIDATGAPEGAAANAKVASYSVGSDGRISVRLSDGTTFVRGQVLLQKFSDPQGLVKQGGNLFTGMEGAGPLPAPVAPQSSGLGKLNAGYLELSNVDLANEFSTLIVTQRAFQASARMITTSDELLQELVNLKR